jgi:hypothetical protein
MTQSARGNGSQLPKEKFFVGRWRVGRDRPTRQKLTSRTPAADKLPWTSRTPAADKLPRTSRTSAADKPDIGSGQAAADKPDSRSGQTAADIPIPTGRTGEIAEQDRNTEKL